MRIKPLIPLANLAAPVLLGSLLPTFLQAASPLVFNATPPVNDLQGTLAAEVKFAQSQILPVRPREGDSQPHLTGWRKCLLLVRPVKPDDTTPVSLTARDGQGKTLGALDLNAPKQLPKTAYFMEGAPEGGIDFTPGPGSSTSVRGGDLGKLNDKSGALLLGELKNHALVEVEMADGRWVSDIFLPQDRALDGKMVRAKSQAGYGSTIHYSGRNAKLSRGQSLQFKCVAGRWFRDGDLENNSIVYSEHAWSCILPTEWVAPGLNLEFRQGSSSGRLTGLNIGAPTQLLLHTIDLGLLTTPRGKYAFAEDPEAHREYFQTLPVSRLIVAQYAPLALTEVMLPNGTLLKDHDPSEGGWHSGTMRQSIGKELISHGIDNANYGLHSTAGQGENSHPYVAAQLTAHNSRGKYANGIQVHGGSGGGGIVTLDSTLGNEFSHEVGHNYGLGHYVGGFNGSVHRSADSINSTWGWDADKNRFLPNFYPTSSGKDTCLDKQCQAPFHGHSFGLDPMAGGSPFSEFNRFTLYTPHTAAIIQRFLEGKAVFNENSPTGFSKWNGTTARMEPFSHRIDTTRETTAPVQDLSEAKLISLLAGSDRVKISMADGNWTREMHVPPAAPANRGRVVTIEHNAGYNSTLFINGGQVTVSRGFKKNYISDGSKWNEGALPERGIERKPQAFGVPVVTLVGYYDPTGEMPSYVYPALHGAYGFCYADEGAAVNAADCELQVETRQGLLHFRLANFRIKAGSMNKFHVNVPEASQPRSVAVVSRGKVLDKKSVAPGTEKLGFTVNGIGIPGQTRAATPTVGSSASAVAR
ncbi:MAG: peptidase M66 [Verrucomicrobiales bacterium]|nr:peptidase M66 [Verrucomicrobiales bacterium]